MSRLKRFQKAIVLAAKRFAGTTKPEPTSAQKQSIEIKRYWNDPERSGAHRIKMVEVGRRVGKSNKGKPKQGLGGSKS